MVYINDHKHREVLANNEYKGYKYYVLSLGTHPTAYIEIPYGDKFFGRNYMDIPCLPVNGGPTYSADHLCITNEITIDDSWFIGWDYAHYEDYIELGDLSLLLGNKKWTTKEMKDECERAIDYIIEENNKHE